MFLDIDGFKEINDRFGHSAGDEVLKEVGQRLLACIRDTDTVARRGGDEFLVIASELHGPEGAALIAEKILAALSLPFHVGGAPAALSASIGIAFYPQDGLDADSLLGKADEAMYQVKRSGKNRYAFASGTAGG